MSPQRGEIVKAAQGQTPIADADTSAFGIPIAATNDFLDRTKSALATGYGNFADMGLGVVQTLSLLEAKATGARPQDTWLHAFVEGARADR
jgi:hypothetical protein